MYFFKNGFHKNKIDDNAQYISQEDFDILMNDLSNGAELKIDKDGKPYAEHTILSDEIALANLRIKRENECFSIINRGECWYDNLSHSQKIELAVWYNQWLDVTDKFKSAIDINSIIPQKPEWLK